MNGRGKALTLAGAVIGLVLGAFQIHAQIKAYIAHKVAEEDARRTAIERLNDHEERLCRLEGGRWIRTDCEKRR